MTTFRTDGAPTQLIPPLDEIVIIIGRVSLS